MVEEPMGYTCRPWFVKSRPENNQEYIRLCEDAFPEKWVVAIKKIDEELEKIIPGYNIAQIKDKFLEMRFYIDAPRRAYEEDVDEDELSKLWESMDEAYAIIDKYTYEAGLITGEEY